MLRCIKRLLYVNSRSGHVPSSGISKSWFSHEEFWLQWSCRSARVPRSSPHLQQLFCACLPGPVPIPENCTTVRIKAWGSAGAYGWNATPSGTYVGEGGGGGYAGGTFHLSPSDMLIVSVSSTHAPTPDKASSYGGPGGDAVFVADGTYAPLVVAGGGGGGSPLTSSTGVAGFAGDASGPLGPDSNGEAGSPDVDPGHPYFRAGGGGGGYPRGGAAGTLTTGAGGGQSYVSSRALNAEVLPGNGTQPGNADDPDNQLAGQACPTGCGMGAVVLIWSE